MWVMMNNSFVSIVAHRDSAQLLCVRGRFKGDVARFLNLPAKDEVVTPDADYRFRMVCDRQHVEHRLKVTCMAIDYDNFKDSCPSWRHLVYMEVWHVLRVAQQVAARAKPQAKWWLSAFRNAL